MNRDLLMNVDPAAVARGSMAVIDAIQDMRPEVQAPALAATFLLLAERFRVPATDLFGATTNIMNHTEGRRPEFAAVAKYMEHEL